MTTTSIDVSTEAQDTAGHTAALAPSPKAKAFIDALHQLAQFLTEHPDLPIPSYPALTADVFGADDAEERAAVDAAAKAMGVSATGTTHYRAAVKFGPLTYQVLTISAQEMADYEERDRLGREAFEAQRQAGRTPDAEAREDR